jgi:hypothetical protein
MEACNRLKKLGLGGGGGGAAAPGQAQLATAFLLWSPGWAWTSLVAVFGPS